MPNFNAMFKAEVARLARKELKATIAAIKSSSAQHRRDIAELKRQVRDLERKVSFLEAQEKRRLAKAPPAEPPAGTRFSPGWVKAHRKKVGLSAAKYAKLVGVSPLTIYNWEHGKSKPQAKQLAAWSRVRGLGKREAAKRLALLK